MTQLDAVLLLPSRKTGVAFRAPANWSKDIQGLLEKLCLEQKDSHTKQSVSVTPEFEITVGGPAHQFMVAVCVHYGEPAKYGLQPNPYASTVLNLWNIHGPVLVFGTSEETGDEVNLSVCCFLND